MSKYSYSTLVSRFATVAAVSAAVVISHAAPAVADGFDLQQFQPMPDLRQNFFSTSSADVAHHMNWSAFMLFNYANAPLVLVDENKSAIDSVVASQGTLHLLGSVALLDRFELGIDVPLVILQGAGEIALDTISAQDASFGIGDLRLVPKAQLLKTRSHENAQGIALALLVDLHLPTGDSASLQGGDFRIGPRLAFDAVIAGGLRLAANLGYQYRQETQLENLSVNDTLGWALAAELPIADTFSVTTEFYGRITPAGGIEREESPTELLLGGKALLGPAYLVGGGGLGLVGGYGTPDWRAFLGFGIAPPRPVMEVAEPTPEPDCDEESVASDCPDVPAMECADGVLVSYGALCVDGECQYESNESQCDTGMECGLIEGEVACVPEPDCLADGDCTEIPAPVCYQGAITTYGGACLDGTCVYEGTITQCEEGYICGTEDGRPVCVEGLVKIDVETRRIELSQTVSFETAKADIETGSLGLLDQVATVLEENPQVTKIRIEGHTDSRGRRAMNVELSKARAAAVLTYLLGRGIEAERMESEGFGPDKPIADNDSESGRARNRRVEIHIIEQGE